MSMNSFNAKHMRNAFTGIGLGIFTLVVGISVYLTSRVYELQTENYNDSSDSKKKITYGLTLGSCITTWCACIFVFIYVWCFQKAKNS